MATRRPASSRARMPPPSSSTTTNQPRARSVMARPASQQTLASSTDLTDSSSSRNQKDEGGTNIQVVIRCRRRSGREMQEGSPMIVTSDGAKSKEISIETGAPVSSLGVVTLPPTRTYPFDLVFGPEADQAMIYHDVVSPMLEQVLQGYNCTLFAYGQTGTGKTYTMQGDLTRTPMGNPSSNAGMIPRVLFRLFHQLESSASDFSVKVSYVELYNEELRDLLASDFSAPNGSTQPMGMAGKDKSGEGGLKIFDDASKRGGIFIQGLEEIAVKDSRDALALLVKGSERRQIAATNFNEHSSRSHSVFSITVHTKDVSFGEDLLKTGKLHLVDLAGSENIGRSGAENKRAREAGMINQSLLTLGRVINALVDKAQHVPYRESKLTRLLQDSLGGRTKTCIIATISPARSNMEETLSTLDYALRAKSIRNKPEVNQRMTRNALLKEYVAEIDRLKADLLAAREKNGIFFSEESWKQQEVEKEMHRTELTEAKKQVEIVEGQLRGVREEYDQSIGLLMQRDDELKQTKAQLGETQEKLVQREQDLRTVKTAHQEEEVVRKAYQDSEKHLNGVATSLKTTVAQSTRDADAAYAKLERKSAVFATNKRIVAKHGKEIVTSSKDLASSIDEYVTATSSIHQEIEMRAEELRGSEGDQLQTNTQALEQRTETNRQLFAGIRKDDETDTRLFSALEADLKKAHSMFETQLTTWKTTVQSTLKISRAQIDTDVKSHNTAVERSVDALQAALDGIVHQAKSYLAEQRQILAKMKENSNVQAASELARLKQENEWLTKMVDDERRKANASKDDLIHRVSGLLGTFLQERDTSLRNAVQDIQQKHDVQAESTKTHFTQREEQLTNAGEKMKLFETSLQQGSREGKRKRETVGEALKSAKDMIDTRIGEFEASTSKGIEDYSGNAYKLQQGYVTSVSSSLEEHTRIKRARIEKTDALQSGLESDHELVEATLSTTYQNVDEFTSFVIADVRELEELASKHQSTSRETLDCLQTTATTILEKGTKEDQVTGETPQKRQWQYADTWPLVPGREKVLDEWRIRQGMQSGIKVPEPLKPRPEEEIENSDPQVPVERDIPTPVSDPPVKKRESREIRNPFAVDTLAESRKRNVSTRRR
ncbi:kinesin [Coprinopsis marcescibilis]|uniref:Kinesin n=1 Tax=Coprinopsis marcescibilis TaxID=230819 RepID=A0A5C3LAT8_COPMA|nr:kinesin [Coprinopsis marcescibilis]